MTWIRWLLPGAIAAALASLVSLALDSPDDALLNSASVAIGALALGLVASALWAALETRPSGRLSYAGALLAGLVVVVVAAVAIEATLSGFVTYALPLAAIAFAAVGVVTPAAASWRLPGAWAVAGPPVAALAALGLGFALTTLGGGESGRLELPEVTSTPPAADTALVAADVAGVTFEVAPLESMLTYTVREKQAVLSTENDAVGRTGDLTGRVFLDGRPSEVTADLGTLESDQDRRDSYVRDRIFQADPAATFVVDDLGELPESYRPGTVFTGTLSGRATVRGVERPLIFEIEAQLDGDTLLVVGRTDFTWADFEITPPDTQFVDVEDNVHIEVLIVARPAT